jgi:hypothetical protein
MLLTRNTRLTRPRAAVRIVACTPLRSLRSSDAAPISRERRAFDDDDPAPRIFLQAAPQSAAFCFCLNIAPTLPKEHAMNFKDLPISALMDITSRPELVFTEGHGSWLTDHNGRTYLDFVQGWAVNALGHSPREITEALAAQALRESERVRALEAAWITKHQEIARDAETQARRHAQAAAAGAIAGNSLRDRAAQFAAAARCPAPEAAAPAGASASAPGPAAVLADVLGRLEAAGRELAAVADARGAAGAACQRAYEALRSQ